MAAGEPRRRVHSRAFRQVERWAELRRARNFRGAVIGRHLPGLALIPLPHIFGLEVRVAGTMRLAAILGWLAAAGVALAAGELVCIEERPAAQLSTNLTAVLGCSRDLAKMQAASEQDTLSAVRSVIGVMGPNTTLVVPLPENTTASDGIPLFCAAFTFDPATGASECPNRGLRMPRRFVPSGGGRGHRKFQRPCHGAEALVELLAQLFVFVHSPPRLNFALAAVPLGLPRPSRRSLSEPPQREPNG